jgi:hypothetical protein
MLGQFDVKISTGLQSANFFPTSAGRRARQAVEVEDLAFDGVLIR